MSSNSLPKVNLRAMEPEDLDVLYKIENDASLWGVGVTNVPYSRYTLHEYIANTVGDIYTDKQVRLMIDNEEGQTIGVIDITDFDPRHRRAELGVVIQRQFRGLGYGEAAIREIVSYSKEILHLHQLYLYVDVHNEVSLDVFKKCGFSSSAILKDWLLMGENYRDAALMQYFL